MPHGRLSRALLLGCALVAITASAAAGSGALVEVNGLVLRADGSYHPRTLSKHQYTPIEFEGHFEIKARGGGPPPALLQTVIDFDRDGRLSAGGLPVCDPARIDQASTAEARRICPGAIVGRGRVEAVIRLPDGNVRGSSPLTIFNGPRQSGDPTAILHARTTVPSTETYAIVVPIERRPGGFRYRATLDFPPIAGGLGTITGVRAEVGRTFTVGGERRSYVAARCSDGILRTHGRFTFGDGTVIDGAVEKACTGR
jgi:hypothetical protein